MELANAAQALSKFRTIFMMPSFEKAWPGFKNSNKTHRRFYALSGMQDQIAAAEDWSLKFARQFYDSCLERLGEDHAQTRGLLEYMASLECRFATRSELSATAPSTDLAE